MDLPTDFPRRPALSDARHEVRFQLGAERRSALEAFSAARGLSPAEVQAAVFAAMLARYGAEDQASFVLVHHGKALEVTAPLTGTATAFARAMIASSKPATDARPAVVVALGDSRVQGEELTLSFAGEEASLSLRAALFEPATAPRLVSIFLELLDRALASPEAELLSLPLCPKSEWEQLLRWNGTATEYPRQERVERQFEQRARERPDAVALTFGEVRLSYQELDQRSNRLARHLVSRGVKQGSFVAIALDRSVDFIVAVLAALKAGGAYVPIDPGYPPDRVSFLVEDAAAPVLLTSSAIGKTLPKTAAQLLELDTERDTWSALDPSPLPVTGTAADAAYVIYTSGTTGKPKGVVVPHHAISRLVINTNYVKLGPADRLGHISNVSFDAATYEIWGAFLLGGTLVGVTRDEVLDLRRLAEVWLRGGVTSTFFTSTLFNTIVRDDPSFLAKMGTLLIGGEALDPVAVRTFLQRGYPVRLLNGYGPTESTTFAACHHITHVPEHATSIPIGAAISNTELWVLDERHQHVPVGGIGELYIGGDGLALEYHRRPELTAERFVETKALPGKRLYKTGDRVRRLPDGTIDYLGRFDDQVKVRGFRIELGEIETALKSHPGVKDAAVAVKLLGGNKTLVGYLLSPAPSADELQAHLRAKVPAYMIPSHWVSLPSFPVSPNGKLDRRALPEPSVVAPAAEKVEGFAEGLVAAVFGEVLAVSGVGSTSDFFELGGHSLAATRVILQLEQKTGVRLPVATVFDSPTVGELAAKLVGAASKVDPGKLSSPQREAWGQLKRV